MSAPGGWISIPGWRRFQHYDPSRRQPPWIKTYLELLDNEDYLSLSETQRSALHGIWMAYARGRSKLRADTRTLSQRLNLRVTKRTLQALSDAGFIQIVASNVLADGYHSASTTLASRAPARSQETETETEQPEEDQEPVLSEVEKEPTNTNNQGPAKPRPAPHETEVLRGF